MMFRQQFSGWFFCFGVAALFVHMPEGKAQEAELAQQLSNPVASLISVPVQMNYDRGIGSAGDGQRITANIQPVIPFQLSDEWSLISRTIVPVIYQNDIVTGPAGGGETTLSVGPIQLGADTRGASQGSGTQFGIGDTVQSLFLSPSPVSIGENSNLILGAGPVLLLPTGTDDLLTTGKWGAGPTAVALLQSGPWTAGALTNQIWSYAGDGSRDDVNATFLQPFVAYTTKDAWTFTLNTEATYDWTNAEWSLPVNAIVSKLVNLGSQPVSLGVGARYWLASPDGGAEGFGARATVTFLFPK